MSGRRAAAYRFDNDTKEWKERGKGPCSLAAPALCSAVRKALRLGAGFVRFMVHNKTKKIRLLLRQDKTLKIRVNHQGAASFLWPSAC